MDKYSNKNSGGMKPDKTCHEKNNEGTMAKKSSLPGQQLVPKKVHNESDFAGDKR